MLWTHSSSTAATATERIWRATERQWRLRMHVILATTMTRRRTTSIVKVKRWCPGVSRRRIQCGRQQDYLMERRLHDVAHFPPKPQTALHSTPSIWIDRAIIVCIHVHRVGIQSQQNVTPKRSSFRPSVLRTDRTAHAATYMRRRQALHYSQAFVNSGVRTPYRQTGATVYILPATHLRYLCKHSLSYLSSPNVTVGLGLAGHYCNGVLAREREMA